MIEEVCGLRRRLFPVWVALFFVRLYNGFKPEKRKHLCCRDFSLSQVRGIFRTCAERSRLPQPGRPGGRACAEEKEINIAGIDFRGMG